MSFSVAQLPNYIALDTWIRFYVSISFRKYVSLKILMDSSVSSIGRLRQKQLDTQKNHGGRKLEALG
jgi:hypothetical protein